MKPTRYLKVLLTEAWTLRMFQESAARRIVLRSHHHRHTGDADVKQAVRTLVTKAVASAAASLGRSFVCANSDFWPASGDNDIAERHITHHLAIAFADAGYAPYFEVAGKGMRVDLLLVKWRGKKAVHAVAVETKLLYSTDGRAAALARDVRKLQRWTPQGNTACLGGGVPVTRMVIASMWHDDKKKRKLSQTRSTILRGWTSASALERLFTTTGWQQLATAVKECDGCFITSKASRYKSERQHLLAIAW